MSGWIVYSKDGSLERCKLRSLEYGGTAMGERAVTATFDYHSEVAFEVFDYIEYRGERFELEAIPTVKKLSSFEYQYELRFVSLKYELERCEMRDLVPSDNGVVYPTPLTFSFTGDVRYLTDRIQACLDAMYGAGVWKITIAEGTSSEEKNITIAQQNCWNALALVNSTYGLNFYIKGRTITIGGEQPLVSHTFEYGKGNGLYEIERASDTETGIVTKLRAYGSTRNLDYSYPKKPEWSDSVLPVSFALSPLRLMLPSFKADGKTDFVLADDAVIAKYGIREASMVYDDIYPSIAGATYNGKAIDEIKAVDAVDESKKTFVVYLHELGFDLEEHLTTSDAQISMKSGALQGYTFTISSIEKQTGGYKITLGKNSLENSEESGAYVPGVNWNMKAGDKFVLLNILMPQKYIRDAENRLLARANEYLAQYSKTNFSYNIGLHDKFLIQNPSVYDSLIEGSKLKVYDKEIGIDEEVTIQSITITENLEDNILPQVKVTLNNEPSASTLDRIQGKLNEVAAETAANGFTTQSEIMAQYRRKLDKPFFDKLFVAIDANGNEIPSTDVITPIAYIKAKYHVASVGGFTMYAMGKDVDIPSLASGLPFDGRTIWYNPDTKQIEVIGGTGGGSGEGVSNFWDLSGIPSWITNSKPKYTYSEIEGTPDLTKYALASQIPSLSGYATESWVLQKNYATKATTLSGYGITDAYTKTNVDELLKSYVTLGGTQTITGEKNFTGGLKVNGSPIYYDTEKKYWKLEGDLLVTGGVTMYGSDSSFTPSTIMDALLYDDATLGINSNGQLYVKGGAGGGINTTDLQNYLTQNSYLNVTSGDNRYLKLSGGEISSTSAYPLTINTSKQTIEFLLKCNYSIKAYIGWNVTEGVFLQEGESLAYIGVQPNKNPYYFNGTRYTLWHEGNFTPSNYLPLSGGTLTGNLTITTNGWGSQLSILETSSNDSVVRFYSNSKDGFLGALGFTPNKNPIVNIGGIGSFTIWHEGNDGSGSGLDADTLDGLHNGELKASTLHSGGGFVIDANTIQFSDFSLRFYSGIPNTSTNLPTSSGYQNGLLVLPLHSNGSTAQIYLCVGKNPYFRSHQTLEWNEIAYKTDNVSSATKLQTARTIWGQSFDGTGDISGHMTLTTGFDAGGVNMFLVTDNAYVGSIWYSSVWKGKTHTFGTNGLTAMTILENGNVGIGTTSPSYKLDVNGDIATSQYLRVKAWSGYGSGICSMWYNGNTTQLVLDSGASLGYNLDVNGTISANSSNAMSLKLNSSKTDWGFAYNGIGIYHSDSQKGGFGWNSEPAGLSNVGLYFKNYVSGDCISLFNEGGICFIGGNVGIGTANPLYKYHVVGDSYIQGVSYVADYISFDYKDHSINNKPAGRLGTFDRRGGMVLQFGTNTSYRRFSIIDQQWTVELFYVDDSGNVFANGGITMYSDQRKKTILNHVELSLKQIANAPLIEHYYNSDEKKITHVGSIAQYWANMNDWFCKLDSEGYYTMEIQNAALASAISIARELDRYETKTDKDIKKLKKRICELEEEVERLKSA